MPVLTNPIAITIIATCSFFTGAAIIIIIKAAIDQRKFRQNIKPGDYAKILVDEDYLRCKYERFEAPFYLFRTIDTKQLVIVSKSKIYML